MKGEVTEEVPERKARSRILAYMAPPPDFVRTAKLHMRSALIVGEMGSGKTTFIEAKLGEAIRYLLDNGVDEGEICYVYGKEKGVSSLIKAVTDIDVDTCMYMYMFNDDAPAATGGHGRRALSKENVQESQAYIMIRHKLRSLGFKGFLFIVHASQVYHLVDITFRRMAVLKFFKTYPDEPADFRLLGPLVGSAGLAALHDLSIQLWTSNDPETTWQAVHRAVAVLKRWRVLAKADPKARMYLDKLDRIVRIEPEEYNMFYQASSDQAVVYIDGRGYTIEEIREAFNLLKTFLKRASVTSNGSNIRIEISGTFNPRKRDTLIRILGFPQ